MTKKTPTKNNPGRIIRISILILLALFLLKPGVGNILLKYKGKCITGKLTEETSRVKYQLPTLVYEFQTQGESYQGDSNIDDLSKVGDSICIVYLDFMPSINRPLSFFEKVNCNCE